ncbi:MAG: hypothetical protein SF029_06170 [bacterium]|nr:hypothetical protein [bacterium]
MPSASYLSNVVLVLLIAFALRMWHLNTESVWHDEGWSIRAITGIMPDDNTPPLYYTAASLLYVNAANQPPLVFRFASVLLGLLGTALAVRLAGQWYGFTVGLAAGLLVAVNPLLWEYSQEVRAYIAVPLIALGLLYSGEKLLRARSPLLRDWALVFLIELAGLYTHNLSVPLIVWLNIALGLGWLFGRRWRRMFLWAALQLALIAAYIPWLLTQSPSGTPLNTPPQIGLALARDIWYSAFLPVLPQLRAVSSNVVLTLLGLLVIISVVVVLIRVWRQQSPRYGLLLVTHALLVPLLSTVLLLAANIDFHPRYYIAAVPGSLILLAAGVASVVDAFVGATHTSPRRQLTNRVRTITLIALVGVIAAVSLSSLRQITTTREYQHDDFAGLARYYASLPPETVILVPFPTEPALQVYYAEQLNIQAQFVNLPLYADDATVLETFQALTTDGLPRPVEFLTWFQLPADVRGMYPCLLASHTSGVVVTETRDFFGLSTQSYNNLNPEIREFAAIEAAPRYAGMELVGADYADNGAGAVCLRTEWRLTQPTTHDLYLSIAILNPLGQPMVQQDALIARPDNVGTALWEMGDSGQAYNLLRLPPGVPLDEYDLVWTVYSADQLFGLDLLDAAGNPSGKLLRLEDALEVGSGGQQVVFTQNRLQADNAGEDRTIETGLPLDVTLELAADLNARDFIPVDVVLSGEGWSLEQSAVGGGNGRLSWHRFIVPPGNSGEAVLRVEGEVVTTYTLIDVARTFEAPAVQTAVDVNFPGVGRLIGANTLQETLTAEAPFSVELVWQAETASAISYTVFVQLIADDGRVLAQSDALPVNGARPTTGWAEGEYLADAHTLNWNITDYTGGATLIAGFYDAANGFQRALTERGADYADVATGIEIQAIR